MTVRRAAVALLAAALLIAGAAAAAPQKVLRVPFVIAETNFDPAFVSDQYSHNVIHEIFEPPLTYRHRPRRALPADAVKRP